jgi:peptidylprolyl isomerase
MGRVLLLIGLLAALAAYGCGNDDSDDDGGSAQAPQEQTATTETVDLTDTSVKPEIPRPSGKAPERLEKEDIVKGKGRAAKDGDAVTVQYVGVSFSNGEQFDASWDRGEPFTFQLGAGEVIEGWDKGVKGMRVGGRRKLTIPPEMGYGPEGSSDGSIAPNETLVFVVDLVELN